MADDVWTDLCQALARGPAVLLLGQRYRTVRQRHDDFLTQGVRHFSNRTGDDYSSLLDITPEGARAENLAYLHTLSQRVGQPSWLRSVADAPWNAVMTSDIASGLEDAFSTPWRKVRPVLNDRMIPEFPRSRSTLHVYRLFGSVDRDTSDEIPPLRTPDLYARHQVAIGMLRQIPDLVTPFGTLFIDGYGEGDWIEPRDLAGTLASFARGQIHLFSATNDISGRHELQPLLASGALTVHTEPLADLIAWGRERGLLREAADYIFPSGTYHVTITDGRVCRFSRDLWNRLSNSVVIIDDEATRPPSPLSAEQRYLEFREFLRGLGAVPRWSDFSQGFAFMRRAQEHLERAVETDAGRPRLRVPVLVLHGQTGVGKTVALAYLAYRFRLRGMPVAFIPRRNVPPDHSDIDLLCETFELAGADRTLIVWDGMADPAQYGELADYLASRGRRALVVGSTYRQQSMRQNDEAFAWQEMPATFSLEEAEAFTGFLKGIDPSLNEAADTIHRTADAHFLVALYRLLPSSRGQLRAGLIREYTLAEEDIRRAIASSDPSERRPLAFSDALRAALNDQFPDLLRQTPVSAPEGPLPEMEELIGLILVPGRFGLYPPIELIARAARGYSFEAITAVLRDFDVFRWYEDQTGTITIGPRHPLEAEEVLNARYASPEMELQFVERLLLGLRAERSPESSSEELEFAIALLHAIGPQGRAAVRYASHLGRVADMLQNVRDQRGVMHPRLLLLEGNVCREWAKRLQSRPDTQPQQLDILARAQNALESAVAAVEPLAQRPRFQTLLSIIHVELASLHGARILTLSRSASPQLAAVRAEYRKAQDHVTKARKYRPATYYPIDVLFWTSRDYVTTQDVPEVERIDILSTLLSQFEEPLNGSDFELDQQAQYQTRRLELARMLRQEALQSDALERLAALGSMAGVYLLARAEAYGKTATSREPRSRDSAESALAILQENVPAVHDDVRCMGLMLQLSWWLASGQQLFTGERLAPGLSEGQWVSILGHTDRLINLTREAPRPAHLFVRGMALFHINRFTEAEEQFRDLDRLAISGAQRVVAHYMYSDNRGQPVSLSGTVRSVNPEGTRGLVYCPKILRALSFVPKDFRRPDLKPGDPLDAFYISFRFRGILAEDVRFYERRPGPKA